MNELSGYVFSPLREGDIALYRGSGSGLAPILLVAAEQTSLGSLQRLEQEFALKAELEGDWAARPVALTRYNGRMALVLEDPGGASLDTLLGRPLDASHFLRIALPLAGALRHVHERGLIHRDIKPANILGIGKQRRVADGVRHRFASPREHQARATGIRPGRSPMAPEQTGRMTARWTRTISVLWVLPLRDADRALPSRLPIRGGALPHRARRCRPTSGSRPQDRSRRL